MVCHVCWNCKASGRELFKMFFLFQAEDGIRDLVRSRGLGDVYKRQAASDPVSNGSCAVDLAVTI